MNQSWTKNEASIRLVRRDVPYPLYFIFAFLGGAGIPLQMKGGAQQYAP